MSNSKQEAALPTRGVPVGYRDAWDADDDLDVLAAEAAAALGLQYAEAVTVAADERRRQHERRRSRGVRGG